MGVIADRLLLVQTSPRLPAGLLSWQGWQALHSGPVYAADPDSAQARAVRASGLPVARLAAEGNRELAAAFRDRARGVGVAVWLSGPDGDPGFARALVELLTGGHPDHAGGELEVVYGSWDPPGARLLDAVATMDRLRSPGGCPWDAAQTHRTLMPYLLEEAYEAYDALEDGDPVALREELGDVLLQVLFHARLAEEAAPPEAPWSVDDVAGDLVGKLVRRHPHVFDGVPVSGPEELHANWERIKRAEKGRTSVTEGVPMALPALALAAALQRRAARAGLPDRPPSAGTGAGGSAELGARLFDLVREATAAGQDAEAALRTVCRAYRDALVAAERPG
ncbi:MAG TPA: MazG family protein [Mycobacteriales bacterium]|nr:MazG family protein [Mycobacteriales bacterium]